MVLSGKPIRMHFEVNSLYVVESCLISHIIQSRPMAHLLNQLRYQHYQTFLNKTQYLLFNSKYEKLPYFRLGRNLRKLKSFKLREVAYKDEPISEGEQN